MKRLLLTVALLLAALPASAQTLFSFGSSGGGGGGGTPCTTTGSSIQYNASGSFGCVTGATSNGTSITFVNSDLLLLGSSTGATTFTSANAGASNFTLTFPAATDQLIARATTDTLTNKTYDTAGTGNSFKINGTGITAIAGNTGTVATTTGAFVSGNCVKTDANHNLVDAATTCGGGGGSTITANSTATSGYSAGQFVYSDGSLVQASAGFTYVGTGQVLAALGTITTNLKAINITGTWNASGTTFDAPLFMNITNTASAAASMLVDLQLGGSTLFGFGKDGVLSFGGGPVNGVAGITNTGGDINIVNGSNSANVNLTAQNLFANGRLQSVQAQIYLNNTTAQILFGGSADPYLFREASDILSIADSTNGTALNIYNNTDQTGNPTAPTNYERGVFGWKTTSNVLTIGTQVGGTGTGRQVLIVSAGLYSAAGVALPTCNSGSKGAQAVVSDATGPTYNATYTSGGAVTAHVVCNGTNWTTQ